MPDLIISFNESRHRMDCKLQVDECPNCIRLLGFALLADKMENFDVMLERLEQT